MWSRLPIKLLLLLAMFGPLFADDPTGFEIWKGQDLKGQTVPKDLTRTAAFETLVMHLDADGSPELHASEVELLVMESGEATLVIGGKIHGTSIGGGEKRALSEGDIVHIPPNLPHQLLVEPGKRVTYLAIKHREDSDDDAAALPAIMPSGKKPEIGVDLGSGFRACVPSDHSPAGTVVDGYRKVVGKSFMGRTCLWEREQPEEAPSDTANPKEKPQLGIDMGDGYRSCVRGEDSPSGTIVDGYRKVSHPSPFGLSCAWEKIK